MMMIPAFENKKPAMYGEHGGQIVPARDVMLRYPITLFSAAGTVIMLYLISFLSSKTDKK